MKATAKASTSYGFESRLSMVQTLQLILARTDRDHITREWILREMGILHHGYFKKATPPDIIRIRGLVSYAMNRICEEPGSEWKAYGSRHNPQWIRVRV